MSGKLVWQSLEAYTDAVNEDLTWLKSGMYQLQLTQEGQTIFSTAWVKE